MEVHCNQRPLRLHSPPGSEAPGWPQHNDLVANRQNSKLFDRAFVGHGADEATKEGIRGFEGGARVKREKG